MKAQPPGSAASASDEDLRSVTETLGVLRRHGLVVLLAALLVGGLGLGYGLALGTTHQAVSRVSLTDRVEWPFYDSERERIAGLAAAPDFTPAVAAAMPPGRTMQDLRVDLPVDQAYVDVVARGSDDTAALDAAGTAATLLVDRSRAQATASERDRLARADADLRAIDASLARVDTELAGASATESSVLTERRAVELRRQGSAQEVRDRAAAALDERDVVKVAVLGPPEPLGAGTTQVVRAAVLAALITALCVAALALFHDARRAPVRDVRHLRRGPLGSSRPVVPSPAVPGTLAATVLHAVPPGAVVGVVSADGREPGDVVAELAHDLRAGGATAVTIGPAATSPAGPTRELRGLLGADTDVLDGCARGAHLRLDPQDPCLPGRALAETLRLVGETVDLVVVDLGPAPHAERRWQGFPHGTIPGLVVAATITVTTQRDVRRALTLAREHRAEAVAAVLRWPEQAGGSGDAGDADGRARADEPDEPDGPAAGPDRGAADETAVPERAVRVPWTIPVRVVPTSPPSW